MELHKTIKDYVPEYWEGRGNLFVRGWTYLNRGLDFVNQARYLMIGVLALYAVLKLTNPMLMVAMFAVSIPALIIMGRWHLYKVSKTQEYVTTTKGSVLGYSGYNLQVRILDTLESIDKKLDKLSK